MGRRVELLGVGIDALGLEAALDWVEDAIRSGRPQQVVTVNSDFLRLAGADAAYRRLLNTADLALADGMPLVWAARLLGTPLPERVAGIDLLTGCAALAAARGYRPFLLGAAPGVAASAADALTRRFPGLEVAGTYAPSFGPFSAAEDARMVRQVRAARPDMLFVAFGAPRQDVWIREHLAELGVPVCVGVGGTLDVLAGRVPRAPLWMQDAGMEWLWRMGREPRRLWRRYLLGDLPVVVRLLAQPRPELEVTGLPDAAVAATRTAVVPATRDLVAR